LEYGTVFACDAKPAGLEICPIRVRSLVNLTGTAESQFTKVSAVSMRMQVETVMILYERMPS